MNGLLLSLLGCWGQHAYIVEGTVVEVHPPEEVVLDHREVAGLMGAMIMPFDVSDPALLDGLEPGHRVVARYELLEGGGRLTKLRITGRGPAPVASPPSVAPVRAGETLPRFDVPTHDGGSVVIGEGQQGPVALTFVYTRCPLPEACPALVARLLALQEQLGDQEDVTLLAVTLDPEFDTLEVLRGYAEAVGAGRSLRLGRVEAEVLPDLAMAAGLAVIRDGGEIVHGLRLLVLDGKGRLVERYDDARFPADRVLEQLRTGGPAAPGNSSGTVTPE